MFVIVIHLKSTNGFAIYKSLDALKKSFKKIPSAEFEEFIKDFHIGAIENDRWLVYYDYVLG